MPTILPLIMTALTLGEGLLNNVDFGEKANKWVQLGLDAAKGIPAAVDIVAQVKAWAHNDTPPTQEDLDALLDSYAASTDLHNQIQSTGNKE